MEPAVVAAADPVAIKYIGMGLVALGMAGAAHAMASLFVAIDPASRSWLPITLGGAGVCAMGLLAVFERAPTA